jgi:hypothetical protein
MPFHEESFFQQDGDPPHYANVVKDYLNETFGPGWIGRGVTKENAISWPARSLDLTPYDFFLWELSKIMFTRRRQKKSYATATEHL